MADKELLQYSKHFLVGSLARCRMRPLVNRLFQSNIIDPSNLAKYGPVAAIIEAGSEAEAIDIANASRFGLGSCVLTGDPARGERIAAQEIEAGMSFVNASVKSDPRMLFGGVKQSGYGRECGQFGIQSSST